MFSKLHTYILIWMRQPQTMTNSLLAVKDVSMCFSVFFNGAQPTILITINPELRPSLHEIPTLGPSSLSSIYTYQFCHW